MLYSGSASSGGSTSDPYKTAVIDTIVAEVQSTVNEDRAVLLLVRLCYFTLALHSNLECVGLQRADGGDVPGELT
jgi:hypothetical protein